MITKEQAYKTLKKLVERFDDHIDTYKKGFYNETQTRVDYINPFFKALGWDIDNEQGLAEAYREVIHEDKIKIGKTTKAPDYCFTVYGQRKFFVDAKKPSINIKSDISPAYQVRRYGWSARLPIAIVTDFEEFSIYDCSKKPNQNDRSSVARIQYLTYKDYLKEFDFIWETFSKERILKGSFDKFVQSDTKKRGTATVDNEFLKEIDEWRKYLATTIALRNSTLSEDEINYAVQKTIDRILFLRICEDRGVEQYGNLKNAIKKGDLYKNLFEFFHIADEKYNSGLFNFKEDNITPNLIIDNKVIKNIVQELYYPRSPFEFSVLPADILGSVYEQFLGKTIRLTKAHQAKIEEKPEVRKAGGVYYTPKYIVDYIVENTVGKLLSGKTPKQAESIKICDPACGSGSFLIGAYQYLLDWHLKYYIDNPQKKKKDGPVTPDGNLTTAEKKRILINNIYGVDIDPQAAEVTKLNLLLKALEGETQASISKQLTFFNERVLPNLGDNIKCGNSLIGNDFYDNQLDLFREQIKKINAFDWENGFPEIFKQGGFDAVIGNPPYRMVQPHNTPEDILRYFKNNYSVAEFKIDLFHIFTQKGISILKNSGIFGFIIPSSILNNVYAKTLREWILNSTRICKISITKEKVFTDADVYSLVIIAEKESSENKRMQNLIKTSLELERAKFNSDLNYSIVKQMRFTRTLGKIWNILINENNADLILKIQNNCNSLSDIAQINRGLITGNKKKYFSNRKENDKYVQILAGGDVYRYLSNEPSQYVLFEKPLRSGGCWDPNVHFAEHKLLIRQIGTKPTATLIKNPIAVTGNIFTIKTDSLGIEKFILGILNSKLIEYFWKIMFTDFKNSFPQVTIFSLNQIPIVKIDFNDNINKTIRNNIIKLVDNLLNLNKELQKTKLDTQRKQLQRAIDHSEKKIDELVYGLYGLTEEEIEIIGQSNYRI